MVTRGIMLQYLHVVDLVFDSRSRNNDGFNDPNGWAVLLQFLTMWSLNNFIKSIFENCTGVSLETQRNLQ